MRVSFALRPRYGMEAARDAPFVPMNKLAWSLVFALLCVLAIPWFLWGNDAVALGLPVWVWWHIAWMGIASAVFALFARRGWGLFLDEDGDV